MNIARWMVPALAALALAGCGTTPVVPSANEDVARDARFALAIHSTVTSVRAGDPIVVAGQLSYLGPDQEIVVSGASPLVGYGLEKVDGNLHLEPAFEDVCAQQTIALATPMQVPFAKSGGVTESDPAAAFWRTYLADPQLRLPVGRWKISAIADFFEGAGCTGPAHHLVAAITIDVVP